MKVPAQIMASVNPSSLIGAQAYATQLRRQYSQEETERAFNLTEGRDLRSRPQAAEKTRASSSVEEGRRSTQGDNSRAQREPAPGNPTASEAAAQPNPPAQPLYSSARREAPNPNAQLRTVRPGAHLDITV
jgi:hypothetical protein